jgi:hypothetical protein
VTKQIAVVVLVMRVMRFVGGMVMSGVFKRGREAALRRNVRCTSGGSLRDVLGLVNQPQQLNQRQASRRQRPPTKQAALRGGFGVVAGYVHAGSLAQA